MIVMKWIKEREPWKAELSKEITLVDGFGVPIAFVSKDNPICGTVTHYCNKKIGRRIVRMCNFSPDIAPDKNFEFSIKQLRKIES